MSETPERIPADEFVPEPCVVDACTAPNGPCFHDRSGGYYGCPHGPYRNASKIIERRKGDRRAPKEGEADRVRDAAQSLVDALDRCKPELDNLFVLQYVRSGRQYDGPTYGEELKALRAALSRPTGREPCEGEGE